MSGQWKITYEGALGREEVEEFKDRQDFDLLAKQLRARGIDFAYQTPDSEVWTADGNVRVRAARAVDAEEGLEISSDDLFWIIAGLVLLRDNGKLGPKSRGEVMRLHDRLDKKMAAIEEQAADRGRTRGRARRTR